MSQKVNTKSLERALKRQETAIAELKQASILVRKLKAKEKEDRLNLARKNAKFRIGDVIRYDKNDPPILIIAIECHDYGNADPIYRGLQVCKDHLTRKIRTTDIPNATHIAQCESFHIPPEYIKD